MNFIPDNGNGGNNGGGGSNNGNGGDYYGGAPAPGPPAWGYNPHWHHQQQHQPQVISFFFTNFGESSLKFCSIKYVSSDCIVIVLGV